jgi:hypothetical protein
MLTMHKLTPIALMALGSCLSACATNSIRLDRAATMSEAGRKATTATMGFAEKAIAGNRNAIIEIVAYDPNCTLPQPAILNGTDPTGKAKLCSAQGSGSSIPFARFTKRDLKPTLAVIEGITAYLDAVDEILGRDPVDLVDALSTAKEDLTALGTITGKSLLPNLSDDQGNAIDQTLALVQTILSEAGQVDDLRDLENGRQEDAVKMADAIKALKSVNATWATVFTASLKSQLALAEQAYRSEPPTDRATRFETISAQMEMHELAEDAPRVQASIDKLADTFAEAHKDYLDLLPAGSNAKLTAEEKKKKAKIIRARVRAALQSLASVVAAF